MDYIEKAKLDDPEGAICGFCGLENDLADDCGWWYSGEPYRAYCSQCTEGTYYCTGDR